MTTRAPSPARCAARCLNTGGGGGGGSSTQTAERGGEGGSGVVIVRYAGAAIAGVGGTGTSFVGNGTIGQNGVTYQVASFTATGNSAFNLSGVDFNARLGTVLTSGVSGTGNLTFSGPGRLTLAANSSYTGNTTVTAGTGSAEGYTLHTFSAGTSTFALTLPEIRATLSGDISGTGGFTLDTPSTLVLTGSNTHQGETIISNGILQVGDGGSTGSLGSGAVINNAALIVNRTGAVTIPGGISGSGSLPKQGPGTLTLSGANSYSGGTVVSAGTLVGTVNIATGGRLAPGNSIESLATGTATFAGGATFAYEGDSSDLDALGLAADLLVVTGDLNLSTDPTSRTLLSFTDIAGMAQPFIEDTTIFALINYSGVWNGGLFSYEGQELTNGSRFTAGSQLWEITYDSPTGGLNFTDDYLPSGSFVIVTAVPEPSTLALLAVAGMGLAAQARRRR
ncbi:MAG: autotransporter-associated beta strand repeat-containing protein [Pirellulales bacterium]